MTKKIKIGVSAMVAFALMFTTSFNVVAQEKVVASDNVEVKTSVEANVLGETLQKLNAERVNEVKTPTNFVGQLTPIINTAWYIYTNPSTTETEIKTATNYQRLEEGTPDCPEGELNVCAIELPNTGVHPTFNSTIQSALWTAQSGGTVASNIQMKE